MLYSLFELLTKEKEKITPNWTCTLTHWETKEQIKVKDVSQETMNDLMVMLDTSLFELSDLTEVKDYPTKLKRTKS